MRILLRVAYDGSSFYGSQIQKGSTPTVIGSLDLALRALGIDTHIVPSARTDRGVHAKDLACHLDLPCYWQDLSKLGKMLNRALDPLISIRRIEEVRGDFHARYDAKRRRYRYILSTKEPSPFSSRYVTYVNKIEYSKIAQNIRLFEGVHDFAYFQKSGSSTKSSVREITKAKAYMHKGFVILTFEANGFLRSQVRLMTAALLGLEATQIEQMLQKKIRYKLTPTSPNGLYLARVIY